MLELRRTVRFAINDTAAEPGPTALSPKAQGPAPRNGFGGSPSMRGLGRYYELDITCSGSPDPTTGYLISIRDIDAAARDHAIPIIARACAETPARDPATLLAEVFTSIGARLPVATRAVLWRLTPTYSVAMDAHDPTRFILRQQFDLAAAHRLHARSLTDEENRRIFGRCNNPSGHGHNYRVEPAVSVRLPADSAAPTFGLADLERITLDSLINPFDHTHLNEDTAEFGWGSGVIPSIENIARVFHDRLAAAIATHSDGSARLVSITVWETDRTSCTYPGTSR